MRSAAAATLGALLAIAALAYAGVPMPRLYGTGCDAYPLGIALAHHEDEFRGRCRTIAPLWR